jgi:hypothetical protein
MITTAFILLLVLIGILLVCILALLFGLSVQGNIIRGLTAVDAWRELYTDAKAIFGKIKQWRKK